MCGRYAHTLPPDAMARLFNAVPPIPEWATGVDIAPTMMAPVVRFNAQTGTRHIDLLRWGLVPHWADDPSVGARMFNARAETVAEKPAFKTALVKRRCLVPAGVFFEWKRDGRGKIRHRLSVTGDQPMVFAGLWEGWRDPETGQWLKSFTIITTAANDAVAPIHDRMPVILTPAFWASWLGEVPVSIETLEWAMITHPAEMMVITRDDDAPGPLI